MATAPRDPRRPSAEIHRPAQFGALEQASAGFLIACAMFDVLRRLFRSEPTVWIEVGGAYCALVWAICLGAPASVFGMFPAAFETFSRWPEWVWSAVAGAVGCFQLGAILYSKIRAYLAHARGDTSVSKNTTARAWAALVTGVFFVVVAGHLFAESAQLPGAWVYGGGALVSLIPFWRQYLD